LYCSPQSCLHNICASSGCVVWEVVFNGGAVEDVVFGLKNSVTGGVCLICEY
jgi:hypothetical protein